MIKDMVSIIVPVYNVERFLPDCLLSLENQTYDKIEVIFVNDGSTDNGPSLLKDFCSKHNYAKLITQNNQGSASARNTGLKYTRGEYVCFFDPDDIMSPLIIEKFVSIIKFNNCDLVSSDFVAIDEEEKYDQLHFDKKVSTTQTFSKDQLYSTYVSSWKNTTSWSMWNKLFKNTIVMKLPNWPNVMPTEISLGEDLYFVTQYLKLVSKSIHINEQLYFYRRRKSSQVYQKYTKKRFNVFKALDHLIVENKLSEQDMNIIKALQAWHGVEALWAMKRGRYDNVEDIKYVYKDIYKKYLKYFWKAKNQPVKMRIPPLSVPVMWVVYRIALKRANKK